MTERGGVRAHTRRPWDPRRALRAGRLALAVAAAAVVAGAPSGAKGGLLDEAPHAVTFKLRDEAASLPWLGSFQNAEIERPGPMRLYMGGRWGRWREEPWWPLSWASAASASVPRGDSASLAEAGPDLGPTDVSALAAGEGPLGGIMLLPVTTPRPDWLGALDPEWAPPFFASTGVSLASNGFESLWRPPGKPVPDWRCRRRPVLFVRYGAEQSAFDLVHCDGAVAAGALDRLSIMMRPPESPSPGELLPDEPEVDAWSRGEWVASVRLAHPRLLWALQKISDAFPRRTIYVFSGYRPAPPGTRGHSSMHASARAIDIKVMGVPNAALFKVCRTLDDVGCGFYPNSKFVHVDVRRPATGRAFWVDVSGPGEPSRYVDAWPGVVDSGALVWDAHAQAAQAQARPAPDSAMPAAAPPSMGSHAAAGSPPP
jgi:hypothetical protein